MVSMQVDISNAINQPEMFFELKDLIRCTVNHFWLAFLPMVVVLFTFTSLNDETNQKKPVCYTFQVQNTTLSSISPLSTTNTLT